MTLAEASRQRGNFYIVQDLLRRLDTGERGTFHEPLPFVERIGVLAGEVEVVDGLALAAGDTGKLAGPVAGVRSQG